MNLEHLLEKMWENLDLTRIYTKKRGEFPDFQGGLILRGGNTIQAVCNMIHRSLADEFKVRNFVVVIASLLYLCFVGIIVSYRVVRADLGPQC